MNEDLLNLTPPNSPEAEQAVLGGLMLNNEAWDLVSEILIEADFYRLEHRSIFRAMGYLVKAGNPTDIITLSEQLERIGSLAQAGGLAYLSLLVEHTPSAANIHAYAAIVKAKSRVRRLLQATDKIREKAFAGGNPDDIIDHAEKLIFEVAESREAGGIKPFNDVMSRTLDRIDRLFKGESFGVPTGFADLDQKILGLNPSDLIIVAGRPSMGKTSFAMNIAEFIVISVVKPVVVFSMEMPDDQLGMRLVSSVARVNQQAVRSGNLRDEDWPKITRAVSTLADAPLFIDDSPGLTPNEIRSRCRKLMREHGQLGLIVIDYLQLMQSSGNKENRNIEISDISRSLKALAKELNVPVMALSQLNRSLEQRQNKRPVMSDLRDSGAIEQDADVVFFIYRDEVYNEDTEAKGTAEVIIGKQRNGPIGTVHLAFLSEITKFENLVSSQVDMPTAVGMDWEGAI